MPRYLILLLALFAAGTQARAHLASEISKTGAVTGEWDIALRDLDVVVGLDVDQDGGIGFDHILLGYDHLLFIAVLLVTAAMRRPGGAGWVPIDGLGRVLFETIKTLTAFTLAHAIVLTLAVLGLVKAPAWPWRALTSGSRPGRSPWRYSWCRSPWPCGMRPHIAES